MSEVEPNLQYQELCKTAVVAMLFAALGLASFFVPLLVLFSVFGLLLAIMAVLRNAFVLLHVPIFAQTIAIGAVIILAVAADQLRRRSR